MKNLIKSKKGGIPAINELVMTFLQTTPKPILALIFILLITTIATFILPIIFNSVGYSCIERESGTLELYQVPANNLYEKSVIDVRRGLEGLLGGDEYELPDDAFPNGDTNFLKIPAQCFVQQEINSTLVTGYVSKCVQCPIDFNFLTDWTKEGGDFICIGDQTDESITGGSYCDQCRPPEEYYYNHTNCITNDECYFTVKPEFQGNITADFYKTVNYRQIVKLGGVLRPQDDSQFANIQCSANQKPSLYFYSIEIFNPTMWILLFVGYALITFAFMWYGVVLK